MPVRPPTFRPRGQRSRQEVRQDYDTRRGSAHERGYDARWTKASKFYRLSHPLCIGCYAVGIIRPSNLVDHVIPHRGDQRLFWDQGNWQAACDPHHDVVKQRLEQLFNQGKVKAEDLRLDSAKAIELTKELNV